MIVAEEKKIADELAEACGKEEAIVQIAVDEATAIKEDCQKDLDEALPMLIAAENALKVLDPKEITVLKSYQNPPLPVKATM